MAITSGFFNSLSGDRVYDAETFGAIFDGMINDGVYQAFGDKFVTTHISGNSVLVGTGRGWFRRTWILNDTAASYTLDASEGVLHRYDAIVIEIDRTIGVRAGTIKVVKGTPSATPNPPTMINAGTVRQWPLCYIYRPGGSASISPANIDVKVGTPECPYAVSTLASTISFFALAEQGMGGLAHRYFWRGQNLGSTYTTDQRNAIDAGTFTNIWLGDYWLVGGVKFVVMDFNYWYGKGVTPFNKNHVVVMPETTLYNQRMHSSNDSRNGYFNCQMRSSGLNNALTTAAKFFTTGNLLQFPMIMTKATNDDGVVTNADWVTSDRIAIPSEPMIFGSQLATRDGRLTVNYDSDHPYSDATQLQGFRVKPQYGASNFWLRDNATRYTYGFCHEWRPDVNNANVTSIGVRPVYAVGKA